MPHSVDSDGAVLGWFFNDETSIDIGRFDPNTDEALVPLIATEWRETFPSLSPDGRWLAYQSDESGQPGVYAVSYPSLEGDGWQLPASGPASKPEWNPNGSELFFRQDDRLMAVPVTVVGDSLRFGVPQLLFETPLYSNGNLIRDYSVGDEGRRFLFQKRGSESQDIGELVLVQNWFEELKRLVPTD